MSKEAAQRLAAAGHNIFPLKGNSKKPLWKDWPSRAAPDASPWDDNPNANIGLIPDLALDFDCKPGQKGAESLEMLQMMGLPDTWTVTTPTGGKHLIYSLPPNVEVPNSVGKIAPNTDVRGSRGYVVAAGSTIDGNQYEGDDTPITEAPQWLIDLCGTPRNKSKDANIPAIELDQAAAVKAASHWLEHEAPTATMRSGSDAGTYKIAARVKDFGISEERCFDLMWKHWNGEKSFPPWPPEKLATKVFNAYNYGTRPPGSLSAEAEFGDDGTIQLRDRRKPTEQPKQRLYAVPFNEARKKALTANLKPLIKGLLDATAMSVVYGESNSGKSFLALDFSYHIAAGLPWDGRKTTPGLVIYVAAEGGGGIYKRIEALGKEKADILSEKGTHISDLPFEIIPCAVDLLRHGKAGDTDALVALVHEIEARRDQPAALVVIDTLSRAIAGGDENAPTDMGAIVRNFDRVRTATGAHLMVIHHSGKDKARGARGHSLLRAATDTELEVDNHVMTATKQRELDAGKPVGFRLKIVDVGTDEDGDKVTSCVVELTGQGGEVEVPLTGEETEWVELLEAAVLDACQGDQTKAAEYVFDTGFACELFWPMSGNVGLVRSVKNESSRRMTLRRLDILDKKRTIRKIKRGQWVMNIGQIGQTSDSVVGDQSDNRTPTI